MTTINNNNPVGGVSNDQGVGVDGLAGVGQAAAYVTNPDLIVAETSTTDQTTIGGKPSTTSAATAVKINKSDIINRGYVLNDIFAQQVLSDLAGTMETSLSTYYQQLAGLGQNVNAVVSDDIDYINAALANLSSTYTLTQALDDIQIRLGKSKADTMNPEALALIAQLSDAIAASRAALVPQNVTTTVVTATVPLSTVFDGSASWTAGVSVSQADMLLSQAEINARNQQVAVATNTTTTTSSAPTVDSSLLGSNVATAWNGTSLQSMTSFITPDDSAVQSLISTLYANGTLTANMTENEKIIAIQNYVAANFKYVTNQAWSNVGNTIASMSGDCEDLAILLASLLIGAGVSTSRVSLFVQSGSQAVQGHVVVGVLDATGNYLEIDPSANILVKHVMVSLSECQTIVPANYDFSFNQTSVNATDGTRGHDFGIYEDPTNVNSRYTALTPISLPVYNANSSIPAIYSQAGPISLEQLGIAPPALFVYTGSNPTWAIYVATANAMNASAYKFQSQIFSMLNQGISPDQLVDIINSLKDKLAAETTDAGKAKWIRVMVALSKGQNAGNILDALRYPALIESSLNAGLHANQVIIGAGAYVKNHMPTNYNGLFDASSTTPSGNLDDGIIHVHRPHNTLTPSDGTTLDVDVISLGKQVRLFTVDIDPEIHNWVMSLSPTDFPAWTKAYGRDFATAIEFAKAGEINAVINSSASSLNGAADQANADNATAAAESIIAAITVYNGAHTNKVNAYADWQNDIKLEDAALTALNNSTYASSGQDFIATVAAKPEVLYSAEVPEVPGYWTFKGKWWDKWIPPVPYKPEVQYQAAVAAVAGQAYIAPTIDTHTACKAAYDAAVLLTKAAKDYYDAAVLAEAAALAAQTAAYKACAPGATDAEIAAAMATDAADPNHKALDALCLKHPGESTEDLEAARLAAEAAKLAIEDAKKAFDAVVNAAANYATACAKVLEVENKALTAANTAVSDAEKAVTAAQGVVAGAASTALGYANAATTSCHALVTLNLNVWDDPDPTKPDCVSAEAAAKLAYDNCPAASTAKQALRDAWDAAKAATAAAKKAYDDAVLAETGAKDAAALWVIAAASGSAADILAAQTSSALVPALCHTAKVSTTAAGTAVTNAATKVAEAKAAAKAYSDACALAAANNKKQQDALDTLQFANTYTHDNGSGPMLNNTHYTIDIQTSNCTIVAGTVTITGSYTDNHHTDWCSGNSMIPYSGYEHAYPTTTQTVQQFMDANGAGAAPVDQAPLDAAAAAALTSSGDADGAGTAYTGVTTNSTLANTGGAAAAVAAGTNNDAAIATAQYNLGNANGNQAGATANVAVVAGQAAAADTNNNNAAAMSTTVGSHTTAITNTGNAAGTATAAANTHIETNNTVTSTANALLSNLDAAYVANIKRTGFAGVSYMTLDGVAISNIMKKLNASMLQSLALAMVGQSALETDNLLLQIIFNIPATKIDIFSAKRMATSMNAIVEAMGKVVTGTINDMMSYNDAVTQIKQVAAQEIAYKVVGARYSDQRQVDAHLAVYAAAFALVNTEIKQGLQLSLNAAFNAAVAQNIEDLGNSDSPFNIRRAQALQNLLNENQLEMSKRVPGTKMDTEGMMKNSILMNSKLSAIDNAEQAYFMSAMAASSVTSAILKALFGFNTNINLSSSIMTAMSTIHSGDGAWMNQLVKGLDAINEINNAITTTLKDLDNAITYAKAIDRLVAAERASKFLSAVSSVLAVVGTILMFTPFAWVGAILLVVSAAIRAYTAKASAAAATEVLNAQLNMLQMSLHSYDIKSFSTRFLEAMSEIDAASMGDSGSLETNMASQLSNLSKGMWGIVGQLGEPNLKTAKGGTGVFQGVNGAAISDLRNQIVSKQYAMAAITMALDSMSDAMDIVMQQVLGVSTKVSAMQSMQSALNATFSSVQTAANFQVSQLLSQVQEHNRITQAGLDIDTVVAAISDIEAQLQNTYTACAISAVASCVGYGAGSAVAGAVLGGGGAIWAAMEAMKGADRRVTQAENHFKNYNNWEMDTLHLLVSEYINDSTQSSASGSDTISALAEKMRREVNNININNSTIEIDSTGKRAVNPASMVTAAGIIAKETTAILGILSAQAAAQDAMQMIMAICFNVNYSNSVGMLTQGVQISNSALMADLQLRSDQLNLDVTSHNLVTDAKTALEDAKKEAANIKFHAERAMVLSVVSMLVSGVGDAQGMSETAVAITTGLIGIVKTLDAMNQASEQLASEKEKSDRHTMGDLNTLKAKMASAIDQVLTQEMETDPLIKMMIECLKAANSDNLTQSTANGQIAMSSAPIAEMNFALQQAFTLQEAILDAKQASSEALDIVRSMMFDTPSAVENFGLTKSAMGVWQGAANMMMSSAQQSVQSYVVEHNAKVTAEHSYQVAEAKAEVAKTFDYLQLAAAVVSIVNNATAKPGSEAQTKMIDQVASIFDQTSPLGLPMAILKATMMKNVEKSKLESFRQEGGPVHAKASPVHAKATGVQQQINTMKSVTNDMQLQLQAQKTLDSLGRQLKAVDDNFEKQIMSMISKRAEAFGKEVHKLGAADSPRTTVTEGKNPVNNEKKEPEGQVSALSSQGTASVAAPKDTKAEAATTTPAAGPAAPAVPITPPAKADVPSTKETDNATSPPYDPKGVKTVGQHDESSTTELITKMLHRTIPAMDQASGGIDGVTARAKTFIQAPHLLTSPSHQQTSLGDINSDVSYDNPNVSGFTDKAAAESEMGNAIIDLGSGEWDKRVAPDEQELQNQKPLIQKAAEMLAGSAAAAGQGVQTTTAQPGVEKTQSTVPAAALSGISQEDFDKLTAPLKAEVYIKQAEVNISMAYTNDQSPSPKEKQDALKAAVGNLEDLMKLGLVKNSELSEKITALKDKLATAPEGSSPSPKDLMDLAEISKGLSNAIADQNILSPNLASSARALETTISMLQLTRNSKIEDILSDKNLSTAQKAQALLNLKFVTPEVVLKYLSSPANKELLKNNKEVALLYIKNLPPEVVSPEVVKQAVKLVQTLARQTKPDNPKKEEKTLLLSLLTSDKVGATAEPKQKAEAIVKDTMFLEEALAKGIIHKEDLAAPLATINALMKDPEVQAAVKELIKDKPLLKALLLDQGTSGPQTELIPERITENVIMVGVQSKKDTAHKLIIDAMVMGRMALALAPKSTQREDLMKGVNENILYAINKCGLSPEEKMQLMPALDAAVINEVLVSGEVKGLLSLLPLVLQAQVLTLAVTNNPKLSKLADKDVATWTDKEVDSVSKELHLDEADKKTLSKFRDVMKAYNVLSKNPSPEQIKEALSKLSDFEGKLYVLRLLAHSTDAKQQETARNVALVLIADPSTNPDNAKLLAPVLQALTLNDAQKKDLKNAIAQRANRELGEEKLSKIALLLMDSGGAT